MHNSIFLSLILLCIGSVSLARPCFYDSQGKINWQFKCELNAVSETGYSCENWGSDNPILISKAIVREECFDANSSKADDQKDLEKTCQKLGSELAKTTIIISGCDLDGSGRQIHRKLLNVRWSFLKLEKVKTLEDGTEQGQYKTISQGKLK